jgi:hypothetical protein
MLYTEVVTDCLALRSLHVQIFFVSTNREKCPGVRSHSRRAGSGAHARRYLLGEFGCVATMSEVWATIIASPQCQKSGQPLFDALGRRCSARARTPGVRAGRRAGQQRHPRVAGAAGPACCHRCASRGTWVAGFAPPCTLRRLCGQRMLNTPQARRKKARTSPPPSRQHAADAPANDGSPTLAHVRTRRVIVGTPAGSPEPATSRHAAFRADSGGPRLLGLLPGPVAGPLVLPRRGEVLPAQGAAAPRASSASRHAR